MYALISTIYRKPSNNDADNSKSLFLYQNKKKQRMFFDVYKQEKYWSGLQFWPYCTSRMLLKCDKLV